MKQSYVIRDSRFKRRAIDAIQALDNGKLWRVDISEHKSRRSLAQNRLMWLWMGEVAKHVFETTGQQFSSEDCHEWFKYQLLGMRMVDIDGDPFPVTKSTTRLSVAAFTDYLERIDHYCAEYLELRLPYPEDMFYDAMGRAA